jgi:hypothetical protein
LDEDETKFYNKIYEEKKLKEKKARREDLEVLQQLSEKTIEIEEKEKMFLKIETNPKLEEKEELSKDLIDVVTTKKKKRKNEEKPKIIKKKKKFEIGIVDYPCSDEEKKE